MPSYLADYHTHTHLSGDSKSYLWENLNAACQAGIPELCMTEHWNLLNQRGERLPTHYDFQAVLDQWAAIKDDWSHRVEVRVGIELGNSTVDTAAVQACLDFPELDFVIGSLHSVSLDLGGIGIFTLLFPHRLYYHNGNKKAIPSLDFLFPRW